MSLVPQRPTNSVLVQRVERAWASSSERPHAGLGEQCCGFDLDQHVGEGETSDAEQGLGGAQLAFWRRSAMMRPSALCHTPNRPSTSVV